MSRAVVGADGRGDDGIGLTMSLAISAPNVREDNRVFTRMRRKHVLAYMV